MLLYYQWPADMPWPDGLLGLWTALTYCSFSQISVTLMPCLQAGQALQKEYLFTLASGKAVYHLEEATTSGPATVKRFAATTSCSTCVSARSSTLQWLMCSPRRQ